MAAQPAAASPSPARLQAEAAQSSIKVGQVTQVTLTLLDSSFQRVKNDRIRHVQLEIRRIKGSTGVAGTLSAARITMLEGVDRYTDIRFTAKAAGTVIVRATSEGLAPAEVIVHVAATHSSLFNLLVPIVHAQEPGAFEILPPYEPIPLNGLSTAHFQIFSATSPDDTVRYRVDTEPAVKIRHDGQESVGVAIVELPSQENLSKQFEILPPARPRTVLIRARALPDGPATETLVEFVAPSPSQVGIAPADYTVSAHERIVPLTVRLLDADSIPLRALHEPLDVRLETDSGSGTFDPQILTFSPTKLQAVSLFHPPLLRFGGPLTILARLQDIDTAEAHFEIRAAIAALVCLALFGGFLGGVARHVYRVRTPNVWPRRWKGRLDPGLLGNALCSALSGLVLFQAIDFGLLHSLEAFDTVHGNGTMAFVLGVVGGFAGIAVFDALSDRVLHRRSQVQAPS
jgi:hypothetical protein